MSQSLDRKKYHYVAERGDIFFTTGWILAVDLPRTSSSWDFVAAASTTTTACDTATSVRLLVIIRSQQVLFVFMDCNTLRFSTLPQDDGCCR